MQRASLLLLSLAPALLPAAEPKIFELGEVGAPLIRRCA